MLRDVHQEAGAALDRELPEDLEDPAPVRLPSRPGIPVAATSSGFVVDLDEQRLVSAAVGSDVVLPAGR